MNYAKQLITVLVLFFITLSVFQQINIQTRRFIGGSKGQPRGGPQRRANHGTTY